MDTPPQNDSPARDAYVATLADPAFDRDHADWPALSDRYVRTRALADLARLPTRPGLWPTLWRIRPLSVAARATAHSSAAVSLQRLWGARLGLVARVDGTRVYGDGAVSDCQEKRLDTYPGSAPPQVKDEALDAQVAEFGGDWLDEIAEVILHRTNSAPRKLLPFPQPPASALL
jgi:hypothetical protein